MEDGIQIHTQLTTSSPEPDSILVYDHEDRLGYHSIQNPTRRYVVGEVPPVWVTSVSHQCTSNDTVVLVDSGAHPEVSVVLPPTAYVGKTITITDHGLASLTNPIRVSASHPVQNNPDALMSTNGISLTFMFTGTQWRLI